MGSGNYTAEREVVVGESTVEQLVAEFKQRRSATP
jgi:hypothetical protein